MLNKFTTSVESPKRESSSFRSHPPHPPSPQPSEDFADQTFRLKCGTPSKEYIYIYIYKIYINMCICKRELRETERGREKKRGHCIFRNSRFNENSIATTARVSRLLIIKKKCDGRPRRNETPVSRFIIKWGRMKGRRKGREKKRAAGRGIAVPALPGMRSRNLTSERNGVGDGFFLFRRGLLAARQAFPARRCKMSEH